MDVLPWKELSTDPDAEIGGFEEQAGFGRLARMPIRKTSPESSHP